MTAHIRPHDLEWETFHDPHGRPTTPTRILRASEPFPIEADFPGRHFHAGLHWHPHDTIYRHYPGRDACTWVTRAAFVPATFAG